MSDCDFVRPYLWWRRRRSLFRRYERRPGLRLGALDDADVGGRGDPSGHPRRSATLSLDTDLAHAVVGANTALAHPALVCDVAIGQSTLATQRVKANLFYRGLRFHRFPVIGDSMHTRTEVVGLKQNTT